MAERLKDKIAIVTGIGAGIGKGCALHFAREGARVFGCDINPATAAATVAEAQAEGLEMSGVPVDLTDEAQVELFVKNAVAAAGGIDILVNAAAYAVFAPIDEMTFADWKLTLSAELDLVFLACRAVWPHMKARGGGAIVNFASANAYVTLKGSFASAHCAGKGGVLAMTRQLAAEGGPFGIRANTISPGPILTAATKDVFTAPHMQAPVLDSLMIRRLGQPQDIANAVLFLASDEASYITAADLSVDGGAIAC